MKYILSFFIAAASLCRFAGTGLSAAEHPPLNIKAAFSVFSPAKSSFTLKYAPLQNLSFYAGNLSFGGLWGSFSSAAPAAPQPLKKAGRSSDVFYTSYADKGFFPLYVAADADFAGIKTSVFIGVEKNATAEKLFPPSLTDYSLRAGAALSLPFTIGIPSKDFPRYIQCVWTSAWKRSFIDYKQPKSWFLQRPPFTSFYADTLIQHVLVRSEQSRFSLQASCTANPYGTPSYSAQFDAAQRFGFFSYNALAFFCTRDYLNQNGSFENERIKLFVNPQLHLPFKNVPIQSVRAGISAGIRYDDNAAQKTALGRQNAWKSSVKALIKINAAPLEAEFGASLAPLNLLHSACTGQTVLSPECSVRFKGRKNGPTAFSWTAGIEGTLYPARKKILSGLKAESGCTGTFTVMQKINCTAAVAGQLRCTMSKNRKNPALSGSVKFKFALKRAAGKKGAQAVRIRPGLNAYTEFVFKNSGLDKIKGDIVLKISI